MHPFLGWLIQAPPGTNDVQKSLRSSVAER
jgi:hypothetical protein